MLRILLIILAIVTVGGTVVFFHNPFLNQETISEVRPAFNPVLLDWQEVASDIPWMPRDAHALTEYQNKLWLMGGLNANDFVIREEVVEYWKAPHFSDVWASEDGINWSLITEKAAWGERRSLQVADFQGKMWLIPGWGPKTGLLSEVWHSEDGANWVKAVSQVPWPAKEGHELVVFQDKLWLLGGVNYDIRKTMNDVWYSEDGINWVEATSTAPWPSRWDHEVAVFKEKLWLIGGMDLQGNVFKDVWYSEDGISWHLATDNPPWQSRQGHEVLVFQDRIWILGRFNDAERKGTNDVWFSEDGFVWKKTNKDPEWLGREDHAAAVFQGRMWLTGGMDKNWTWQNDVWYSSFNARKDTNIYSLLAIVNKNQPLPASYIPPDLAKVSDWDIPVSRADFLLRKIALPDLKEMINRAADEGINLKVISAYRSYDYQEETYNHWVRELGEDQANRVSAKPGHSEHQLGTAVDFNKLDFSFADTPAGIWLQENAGKYGWALSYPKDSETITGYAYEPWHYRYIGKENAAEMEKTGIILFDYLEYKNKKRVQE